MKRVQLVVMMTAMVIFSAASEAKNVPRNHVGELLRMESVPCGPGEPSGFSKAIVGSAPAGQGQEDRLCPEYVLRSDGLYYRIRPRNHKHPVLLPIGEQVQFRMQKDRMLLQVEDFDDETYQFSVLAIVPENHGEGWRRPVEDDTGPTQ